MRENHAKLGFNRSGVFIVEILRKCKVPVGSLYTIHVGINCTRCLHPFPCHCKLL